jgi:Lrp/AsnC family leucine-responsive transcriptional regulator
MDDTDKRILQFLSENARMKASAISQEVNLSVSAVISRIQRMEANEIIRGYTVVLNPEKVGTNIGAWMEIRLEHNRYTESFVAQLMEMQNVTHCDYLTGEYDFLVEIRACSKEILDGLHQRITAIEGVCATKTHFILRNEKETRATLLPLRA